MEDFRRTGAGKLLQEQYESVVWDRTSYNSKQDCYTMKRSRYNTVFTIGARETQNVFGWFFKGAKMNKQQRAERKETLTSVSESHGSHTVTGNTFTNANVVGKKQRGCFDAAFASKEFILDRAHPNYVEATRNPFAELPLLSKIRDRISEFTNVVDPGAKKGNNLNAEGNWYRDDTIGQIGWHGDGERRVVVCLCLGRSSPLYYAWRAPKSSENVGMRQIDVHHGDIYVMSSKATGSDWLRGTGDYPKGRRGWRLVHAAGNVKGMHDDKKKRKRGNADNNMVYEYDRDGFDYNPGLTSFQALWRGHYVRSVVFPPVAMSEKYVEEHSY